MANKKQALAKHTKALKLGENQNQICSLIDNIFGVQSVDMNKTTKLLTFIY